MSSNTSDLLQEIIKALATSVQPTQLIPSQLVSIGSKTKSGLSARNITAATLQRLSGEGIPIGPVYGKDNLLARTIEIFAEEIINEIISNGKIQISIDPGSLMVSTIGSNVGGPVASQGMNTNTVTGEGVIT